MTFIRILMIAIHEKKNLNCSDAMIVDIMTNKKNQAIIKELFIRCRKVNICCSNRCQIKFNTLFDYEDNNRKELQNIASKHPANID